MHNIARKGKLSSSPPTPTASSRSSPTKNIDVRIVRIPVAHTRAGELIAEQCAELMLPRRYRDLWRRDYLRAVGTVEPLTAEAALDALAAKDCVAALNSVADAAKEAA
jgi:hypothetical protein